MANKELVEEWIKKAGEDELSARVIIEQGGAPGTACFLCQQMIEKLLKALLTVNGHAFPKTHDLLQIASLIAEHNPEFVEGLKEDLLSLNRYYIETRYPGDFPEFTLTEAQEAYAGAVKVKEAVMEVIEKL